MQRERLLHATARAYRLTETDLTVRHIIELAHVGRNTFYEYFDDAPAALSAVRVRIAEHLALELDQHVSAARTPVARLRTIAHVWFSCLDHHSDQFLVGLDPFDTSQHQLSRLGETLLASLLRATRILPHPPIAHADTMALAVAAAFEGLARAALASSAPHPQLEQVASQLLVRAWH